MSLTIILRPKTTDYLPVRADKSLLPGEATLCRSVDSIVEGNNEAVIHYPLASFNSMTLSGMPPHILIFKRHSIGMLRRNLTAIRGLLNGTRILILSINNVFIRGKILSGSKI
uniref:DNA helicase Pif1-like 2B domain-containing protein n=1 Tax=Octopus bimaculoides TaxID=37653 RepID=A0A0L8FU49_OCTBM